MATTIKFKSGEAVIPAEMFDGTGIPNGGVVVIAYGSDGMTDDLNGPWASMIREYADGLSRKGFSAIIPDYFAKTGTEPGKAALEQIPIHVDAWQATVGDAITYAKTLPSVIASRVGLLGFSLGGAPLFKASSASQGFGRVLCSRTSRLGISCPRHAPRPGSSWFSRQHGSFCRRQKHRPSPER
jgi:dienelactone hydrolase